jgi:Bacterial aa3 type cytochrome c oxidase subunit IV
MASGNDMRGARETYGSFIGMVKWSTVVTAIIVAIVVLLISS